MKRRGWYFNRRMNLYECYSTKGVRIATMKPKFWARARSMWEFKLMGEIE